jgi:hypothetical protein
MREIHQGRRAMGATGHADHFLRRLDRVSDGHVERALTLYRDSEMLREVLSRARLSDGAERVAISLDDPVNGPFVIVTRTGAFVTCLGPCMRVKIDGRLTLVTREQLDAAAGKVTRMRERLAQVDRFVREGGEGAASGALRRLGEDGLRFCREDAQTLLTFGPIVANDLVSVLARCGDWIHKHAAEAAWLRFDRLRGADEQLAETFGRAAWAFSHLMVLTDQEDARDAAESARRDADRRTSREAAPLWSIAVRTAFCLGTSAHATRALWVLAQRPREALALLDPLDESPHASERVLREAGLGAVALASHAHRFAARKALARAVEDGSGPWIDRYAGSIGALVRSTLDAGQACAAGDMPDEVSRVLPSVGPQSWLGDGAGIDVLLRVLLAMPWIVRAGPADLFLPRARVTVIPETGLADVAAMVVPFARETGLQRQKPVRRHNPSIGRNDPCPCGSGRKLKRCCGAVADRHARAA